jgi:hypothetical protein
MTWAEAAGQIETAASLSQLPTGLTFTESFPEPIRYDVDRKLLIYRGFMDHASFEYLLQLSKDAAYGVALGHLYAQSASPPISARRWPWFLAAAVLLLAAAAFAVWAARRF